MTQKNSKTKKYKSLSTGQPCNGAQYAAELVCIRKREKENCGNLEFKFWNKSQKDEYQIQIRVASNLISKYSESSLIRYLNSPSGNNIYSLGFLHKNKKFVLPLRFVEKGLKAFYEKEVEESKKEKVVVKPTTEKYKKKKSRKSGSLFAKIRKIDGKN
jgi:hypothetical protein